MIQRGDMFFDTKSASTPCREAVSVPAGTFETVKIGCRDKRSRAATYEAWYEPAAKQVVRWHGHWADGLEKRELIRFMLN